jgi:hypothetical protein
MLSECRLGIGFTSLHSVKVIAHTNDLGYLLQVRSNICNDRSRHR